MRCPECQVESSDITTEVNEAIIDWSEKITELILPEGISPLEVGEYMDFSWFWCKIHAAFGVKY